MKQAVPVAALPVIFATVMLDAVGIGLIFEGDRRQTLHDRAAGTLVVDPLTAKRLQLNAGDQVRAVALSAARESK